MNNNIIRAWKDREYRESLSAEELALLPANPAGQVELTADELDRVVGGDDSTALLCGSILLLCHTALIGGTC